MEKIYVKLFDFLEIGDDFPAIIMGVLNLSPESFYKGSVYEDLTSLENIALDMIKKGAKMLDLGARSTAPWSRKITIKEELDRIIPSMELLSKLIPNDVIISVDTQYKEVAQQAYDIALKFKKKIIINDVSGLKTDPELLDFIVANDLPVVLMISKSIPGDILTIDEIIHESKKTFELLKSKGYDDKKVIIDPGIGRWIEEKTPHYDMKIIGELNMLHSLKHPILIAISRKSFIGATLDLPEPEKRLNGTLSATAIAVYNGAHIIRTHDVTIQLLELVRMAQAIRKSTLY